MTEPDHQIPGIPTPPPEINKRQLWVSLLLPTGILIVSFLLTATLAFITNSAGDTILGIVFLLQIFAVMICWAWFGEILTKRFRGPSYLLLILAYPLAQLIILLSVSFVGCLAIYWLDGYA